MTDIAIRRARAEDLDALLAIYNHYVANTHITFDVEPRTREQRKMWLEGFSDSGRRQCLVAARGGTPIGWASSGPFKDRAAYDTSVETSVYLTPEEGGKGYGRRLYQALFDALAGEDVHRAFGGIAQPNEASVGLHLAMGFRHVGTYSEVGRKFGRFWDVAWYEKALA
ncbi:MAG TPA: GNAT family N-acetyltransferase [Rhizomicrobium sp.]|nr:GNAT family N-acetyltransferase [Rhizomicrobium sp.]